MRPPEKENEFKTVQFQQGYLAALQQVFDELSRMHHDPKKYDRKVIDDVWEKIKRLELLARNGKFSRD